MAYANKFEDLEVWQRSRQLTKAIYEATTTGKFAKDFGLSKQIQRASVSIMSNIAEGFDRGNKGDFQRFLLIARASCGEVQSQLYVALDINYLSADDFQVLQDQAKELGRMLSALQRKVYQQWQYEKG